jgi:type III pantothenate kinase
MYLLIDAGNSRLKYGLHDGEAWLLQQSGSLQEDALAIPAGFAAQKIVIANVAGQDVARRLQTLLAPCDAPIEWLKASVQRCGVVNDYENPAALGADRWAAAIAAWQQMGEACMVISAGTATTIDLVSQAGHFRGGCILPGLVTMLESLTVKTADLPMGTGHFQLPPRNTHDAITTGCLLAQAGAIERMASLLGKGAPVLLTGGNAERIQPYLQLPVRLIPGLVLDGLLEIATDGGME